METFHEVGPMKSFDFVLASGTDSIVCIGRSEGQRYLLVSLMLYCATLHGPLVIWEYSL